MTNLARKKLPWYRDIPRENLSEINRKEERKKKPQKNRIDRVNEVFEVKFTIEECDANLCQLKVNYTLEGAVTETNSMSP